MATKKVSYMNLLKEAIQGIDPTAPVLDVKGPMLDPILKYSGEGELPTNKDASSILERYYFGESQDKGISVVEEEGPIDNEIDEVPNKNVSKTKKDIEKEIKEQDDEIEDEEIETVDKEVTESDKLENAIIEKLIEEMEEEVVDENRVAGDRGAGDTEAAGTKDGDPEKIIKGRKDKTNEAKEEDKDEDKDKEDLDLDKELGDSEIEEALGPDAMDVDKEDHGDDLEEAFSIFKEEIEKEEIENIDPKKVRV